MNPPSLYLWANWYTLQWDSYIKTHPWAQNHIIWDHLPGRNILFRETNKVSYHRFRELMQLLDCSLLDVETLIYQLRPLVASFMYIILGKDFEQFTLRKIVEDFPTSSKYLLGRSYAFNDLFSNFLQNCCGLELLDLLPSIQYASSFFSLEIDKSLPMVARSNPEVVREVLPHPH